MQHLLSRLTYPLIQAPMLGVQGGVLKCMLPQTNP